MRRQQRPRGLVLLPVEPHDLYGANKGSYPIRGQFLTLWDYFVSTGSARNHSYWSKRGFGSRNLDTCNTFTAPASRVS